MLSNHFRTEYKLKLSKADILKNKMVVVKMFYVTSFLLNGLSNTKISAKNTPKLILGQTKVIFYPIFGKIEKMRLSSMSSLKTVRTCETVTKLLFREFSVDGTGHQFKINHE